MRKLLCLDVYRSLGGGNGIGSLPVHFTVLRAQALDAARGFDFPFPSLFPQAMYRIENSPVWRILTHVNPLSRF